MIRLLRGFGPRLIRLQFSLSSLFLLTTAAAAGTWYWYQRPYPVERWVGSLYPVCTTGLTQPLPKTYREVQYYRRVRGGEPIEHGRYLGYDAQGNLLRTGYYRNGKAHGEFIDYSPTGRKRRQSTLVNGRTHGVCHDWDIAGDLVETSAYLNGELHGTTRRWHSVGKLESEDTYDHGILHGPFDHRLEGELCVHGSFERGVPSGQWTWFPYGNTTATIRGQWREGRADRRWEWTGPDGRLYLTADFDGGRLLRSEPNLLHPRVIQEAINHISVYFPGSLSSLFGPRRHGPTPMTLDTVAQEVQTLFCGSPTQNLSKLHVAGMPGGAAVPAELRLESSLSVFAKMLKQFGLGYDVRHGLLVVDPLESIAEWKDQTGVAELVPPAGSRLEGEWNRLTYFDVVEMALCDAVAFLSEIHSVAIDMSPVHSSSRKLTAASHAETAVTVSGGNSLRFKDALALMLEQVKCKASLRGETIVVEPQ